MKDKYGVLKNSILFMNVVFYYFLFINANQYIHSVTYVSSMLFMIFNSLFIYFYGILRNDKKTYEYNVITYIVFYLLVIFTFTFIIGRREISFYSWTYQAQLRPFYTIYSQINHASKTSFFKNIIGNSIMLIPFSFLLMIKNKKFNNILRQTIIILPVVIITEILQAFTHTGVFDIDDIILNYLGVIIFTFIITRFKLIDKIRKTFFYDFNLSQKVKKIMFYIVASLLLLFDALSLLIYIING